MRIRRRPSNYIVQVRVIRSSEFKPEGASSSLNSEPDSDFY